MISANGGLLAHRYTPQVTQRWPRGSEPASPPFSERCIRSEVIEERRGGPQWAPTPPPSCPKDTWRPHIRRRRPPCPKGGVRTHTIGALRHIPSPLDLQHGPRGSKIEKRRDRSKYVYHNEIYMWRLSQGGIWPNTAQKSPDERPHPSPKHKNKQKCQGGSITVLLQPPNGPTRP